MSFCVELLMEETGQFSSTSMENITYQRLITIERLEDFYGATILAFYDHFTFYCNIIHNL